MAILDDLKGILSPAEFAKLEGNAAVKTKLTRGDELRSYYEGEEDPPPAARTQDDPPPARREPPANTGGQFDLSAVERMLDAREQKNRDFIKAELDTAIKSRGDELYNSVRAGVRTDALQLVKIYTRHQEATGKSWDDAEEVKFNDFLKVNNEAVKTGGGKRYATLTEAYNDYIAPVVTERTIESEVEKRVKATSGQHVPGTTPAPSVNSNIMHFKKRAVAGDGTATTGAQRAAALLDKRLAEQTA
jgi:hypothetical protein